MNHDRVAQGLMRDQALGHVDLGGQRLPVTFEFETAFRYLMLGRAVSRIGWDDPDRVVQVGSPKKGDVPIGRRGQDLTEDDFGAEDWCLVARGK